MNTKPLASKFLFVFSCGFFLILLNSCDSTRLLSPSSVSYVQYIQENGEEVTGLDTENLLEFCEKRPDECGPNIGRIVIGGCGMGICNMPSPNRLTLPADFLYAEFKFIQKNNPQNVRIVNVDQNSKKSFLSKIRYENIDFINPKTLYNIEIKTVDKKGENRTSKIENIKFLNKQNFKESLKKS